MSHLHVSIINNEIPKGTFYCDTKCIIFFKQKKIVFTLIKLKGGKCMNKKERAFL